MATVLVTGMSGTGKSTALEGLRRRGFDVVDTDSPSWIRWAPGTADAEGEWVWREDRIADLLAGGREGTLYVSWMQVEPGRVLRPVRRGRPAERS